jgi:hypothetical protein
MKTHSQILEDCIKNWNDSMVNQDLIISIDIEIKKGVATLSLINNIGKVLFTISQENIKDPSMALYGLYPEVSKYIQYMGLLSISKDYI